jgi:hypothetical protein
MRKLTLKHAAACILCFSFFFFPFYLEAQAPEGRRSLDEIFPGLEENEKKEVFSEAGLIRSYERDEPLKLIPAPSSGIDLQSAVMRSKPSYLAESLLVVPYGGKNLDRIDAYNAAGNIRGLKGRLYHSFTRQANIPLFEDATRIESPDRNNSIPDPPPASELPVSDTVYIRLKDVNFGNCDYRAALSSSSYGVTCNLTNYKTITYIFFTVMKEERFSAILYMEPLEEGMLIYSVAGTDASNFVASKIDIPSAIEKRLAVFIGWISDGVKSAK